MKTEHRYGTGYKNKAVEDRSLENRAFMNLLKVKLKKLVL